MDDQGFPISNSKLIGEKRSNAELGERHEFARKRTKMRPLDSVLRSDESIARSMSKKETGDECPSEEISLVTNVPLTLDFDVSQAPQSASAKFSFKVVPTTRPLDLNTETCVTNVSESNCIEECAENCTNPLLLKKLDREDDDKFLKPSGFGVDLNAEYISSSVNQQQCFPSKNYNNLKLSDVSECASTTGPIAEKDPLMIWKEMKQNGFLSSTHGGISFQSGFVSSSHGGIPMPKQRGRKTRNDVIKKKMELAKREQVDRFTKIAAPSGLLNGLNPGIINHVRNRKQVHSIIEALVRSEKHKNDQVEGMQSGDLKSTSKDMSDISESELHRMDLCKGNGSSVAVSKQIGEFHNSNGEGDSCMVDQICGGNSIATSEYDDTLALKLSSSTKAPDESSTFSNEESANMNNVSSLSMKAATVASQWLDLLNQDIKGRLSALRRSRKRVRAVIMTELPFLISKEFSCDQENVPHVMKSSFDGLTDISTAAMHKARWISLFDQMDKGLSEEEKQLENWLNQVKEMQLRCDHGLQHFQSNTSFDFQQHDTSENFSRSVKADRADMELAVRAAAASMYSTCNFVMSKENVSCF